jgi:hypothetical protein
MFLKIEDSDWSEVCSARFVEVAKAINKTDKTSTLTI